MIKRCGSESVKLLNDARPSPVTAKTNEVVLNSLPPEAEITVLNASAPGDLAALYPVLRAARQDGVDEIKRGAYPALDQRHEFARDVAPWMAGAGRGAEPLRAPLPLTDP